MSTVSKCMLTLGTGIITIALPTKAIFVKSQKVSATFIILLDVLRILVC